MRWGSALESGRCGSGIAADRPDLDQHHKSARRAGPQRNGAGAVAVAGISDDRRGRSRFAPLHGRGPRHRARHQRSRAPAPRIGRQASRRHDLPARAARAPGRAGAASRRLPRFGSGPAVACRGPRNRRRPDRVRRFGRAGGGSRIPPEKVGTRVPEHDSAGLGATNSRRGSRSKPVSQDPVCRHDLSADAGAATGARAFVVQGGCDGRRRGPELQQHAAARRALPRREGPRVARAGRHPIGSAQPACLSSCGPVCWHVDLGRNDRGRLRRAASAAVGNPEHVPAMGPPLSHQCRNSGRDPLGQSATTLCV